MAGVPLGTLLGQQLGWHSTFWAMAGLGLLAALATAALVPYTPGRRSDLKAQLAAFRNVQVWLALLLTALAFGAVYAPFTYIAPLMTEVAGFAPSTLPWLLALFGSGLVIGNVIGARAADRRLLTTIVAASVAMLVVLVVFAGTAQHPWSARSWKPEHCWSSWSRCWSPAGRPEKNCHPIEGDWFFRVTGYQPVAIGDSDVEMEQTMLVLGLILLLIGIFAHISILYTIGIILLIIGAVLWILGAVGRPVGGRKVWF